MRQHDRKSLTSWINRRAGWSERGAGAWTLICALLCLVLVAALGVAAERWLLHSDKREPVSSSEAPAATEGTAVEGTADGAGAEGAAPTPTVAPATVNVMMVGDVLMHDELVDSGYQADGSLDYGFLFDHITPYLAEADLKILNQETVMGDPGLGYHLWMGAAGPIMNTPTAVADAEVAYGFNCILKATNHTLDLGYDGLTHELDYWRSAYPDIPVVGVNNPALVGTGDDSQNYVDRVLVEDVNGLRIAILNYTWATNENTDWDSDHQVISYMSEDKIRADVEQARAAGAEMIIACPHWGIEYDTWPSDEEMNYSKLFCDLGVDVIFGAHPHILQRVETLTNAEGHQTVCFYSLGNYVAASLMDANSLIGGIGRVTLSRETDGSYHVSAASLVPTVICHTYGPNMTAFPISEWTYDLTNQGTRPTLTPDFAYSFCADVLGDGFDTSTGVYTHDLTQAGRLV